MDRGFDVPAPGPAHEHGGHGRREPAERRLDTYLISLLNAS
jgi:hypothetical protein